MAAAGQQNDPPSRFSPEHRAADSLPFASGLGFVGGFLDAFLYVNHGHVFAGAMTGNMALCAISLLSHNGQNMYHHAVPLVAFVCGVWAAEALENAVSHHAVTIALGIEAVGLLFASFLPGSFPDTAYVFLVALVAAFQTASFRMVDQYSYNSTFITGDLGSLVFGLYQARDPVKRQGGLQQARDFGLIVAAFFAGAVVAAAVAPRMGNHVLWIAFAALLVIFAMAVRRSVRVPRDQQTR